MHRINGCTRPFDVLQILTWTLFPLLLSLFYTLSIPLFSLLFSLVMGISYGLVSVAVVYNTWRCSSIDPSDDCINVQNEEEINQEDSIFCNVCQKYV